MEFKRIRDAHISESAAETNRLVIRLEKVDEQRERLSLANKSLVFVYYFVDNMLLFSFTALSDAQG